jgi:hypothetical protein
MNGTSERLFLRNRLIATKITSLARVRNVGEPCAARQNPPSSSSRSSGSRKRTKWSNIGLGAASARTVAARCLPHCRPKWRRRGCSGRGARVLHGYHYGHHFASNLLMCQGRIQPIQHEGVAVGSALTGAPPHGPGRAELPHPVLTSGERRGSARSGTDAECGPRESSTAAAA